MFPVWKHTFYFVRTPHFVRVEEEIMRNGSFKELLELIMEYVGEECITVRREYGEDDGFGVVIIIGDAKRIDNDG